MGKKAVKKIKVCLLTTSYPRFSDDTSGVFINNFAQALGKCCSVLVVTQNNFVSSEEEISGNVVVKRFKYFWPRRLQIIGSTDDPLLVEIKKSLWAKINLPFYLFFFFLNIILKSHSYDLIHAHWIITGFLAALGKQIHKKPIILSVRGSDLNNETYFTKLMNKFVLKKVDHIIAVSEDLKKKSINLGIEENKIDCIPNGVDLSRFGRADTNLERQKLGLPVDKQIILFAGRVTEYKGISCLLEAVKDILKYRQDFILCIVGNSLERKSFEKDYHGLENIKFVGMKSHFEMPSWIKSCNFLTLPSFSEGRPNVILEAMACGKPIIASKVGGIPELVFDNVNGFLIDPGNVADLTSKIDILLKDNRKQLEMGRKGYDLLLKMQLSWERNIEKTLDIYNRVLSG